MRRTHRRSLQSQINVVPYVDVMLVLLVIFMVTAPLISQAVIDLPSAGDIARSQQHNALEILMPAEGGYTIKDYNFSGEETAFSSLAEMTDFIRERQLLFPDAPVLIAADRQLAYERVVDVLSALHAAGIKNFGLVAETDKPGP